VLNRQATEIVTNSFKFQTDTEVAEAVHHWWRTTHIDHMVRKIRLRRNEIMCVSGTWPTAECWQVTGDRTS